LRKKCILCNYLKLELLSKKVRDSKDFKVLKCLNCYHVQIYPIPSKQDEKKFYDKELQNSIIKKKFKISELRKNNISDVERRANLIKKIVKKREKILEVGSGDGFFLEKMFNDGYKITGIEISKQRRERAKKITKARIIDHDLSYDSKNIEKFDTIVLFHVLEHIQKPKIFLKNISKLLNPKGKIIVEVPNFNDFQIKINESYKNWQLQRAHIHYFTPKILKKILRESKFTANIIGIQRYSIENMFSWKMTKKPQINSPKFSLEEELKWIEKDYKKYLEKKLISDTIIAVGTLK
jgi:2-polyprenyl-3-methyl-5-hydroxy-6-metoxy-1,4-benzoquinol methylase